MKEYQVVSRYRTWTSPEYAASTDRQPGYSDWTEWNRVSGKRIYATLTAAKIRQTLEQRDLDYSWSKTWRREGEVKIQCRLVADWEDL